MAAIQDNGTEGQGEKGSPGDVVGLREADQEMFTHYPVATGSTPGEEAELLPTLYPQRERQAPSYYSPGSAETAIALVMTNISQLEPSTVEEALNRTDADDWKAAIDSELQSLQKAWNLVY